MTLLQAVLRTPNIKFGELAESPKRARAELKCAWFRHFDSMGSSAGILSF